MFSRRQSGLECFASGPLTVREERILCRQGKSALRLIFIVDLHLGIFRTEKICRELEDCLASIRPDGIVLGGDFLDRRAAECRLREFFQRAANIAPTVALPGNHDRYLGLQRIRTAAIESGAHWLPDAHVDLEQAALRFECKPNDTRTSMTRILCLHDPAEIGHPAALTYPLALAGHLHGSQLVLAQRGQALYPGRFVFRWNLLRHDFPSSTLVVSRGVNDTLPLRWNCPREVVLCHLQ